MRNHITSAEYRNLHKKKSSSNKEFTRGKESLMQESCVDWFRWNYPRYRKLLFSVPNGGFRTITSGATMKKEGMLKGVSDLLLLVPRNGWCGLAIEFKVDERELSQDQLDWGIDAMEEGFMFVVVRSKEAFKRLIKNYLIY